MALLLDYQGSPGDAMRRKLDRRSALQRAIFSPHPLRHWIEKIAR